MGNAPSALAQFLNPIPREFSAESFVPGQKIVHRLAVHIFPHDGVYAIPQGRESQMDQVTLQGAQPCRWFSVSRVNEPGRWTMNSATVLKVQKKSSLILSAKNFSTPLGFDCGEYFDLLRKGGLKTYRYSGLGVAYRDGKILRVINVLDLETYLRGVVPSEVPISWPLETLKAQAVAARTYAVASVLMNLQNLSRAYDVVDTVQDQVYAGVSDLADSTDFAIQQTRQQILRDRRDQPIIAYFSADSGGHTEAPENVWGRSLEYLVAKPEVYTQDPIQPHWIAERSANRLGAPITGLRILKRTPAQRVAEIEITYGRKKRSVKISGPEFARRFQLRSPWFDVQVRGAVLVFNGRGFGHGVGMSQWGAKAYADMGWSFEQILKFYFSANLGL